MVQFIQDIFVRQHILNVGDREHFFFHSVLQFRPMFVASDLSALIFIIIWIFLCNKSSLHNGIQTSTKVTVKLLPLWSSGKSGSIPQW